MTAAADTLRVFIALDLPPEAKTALSEAMDQLRLAIPAGVRWVDPQGTHLTLKFLGDIESSAVDGILAAMERAAANFGGPPFQLALSQLGVFPNANQPRVLWAGARGDLDALARLQCLVEEALCALGYDRESRPFRPHLTIGRVRDGVTPAARRSIGEAVTRARMPAAGEWQADALHLIRSTRTPSGAIYTSVGWLEL